MFSTPTDRRKSHPHLKFDGAEDAGHGAVQRVAGRAVRAGQRGGPRGGLPDDGAHGPTQRHGQHHGPARQHGQRRPQPADGGAVHRPDGGRAVGGGLQPRRRAARGAQRPARAGQMSAATCRPGA